MNNSSHPHPDSLLYAKPTRVPFSGFLIQIGNAVDNVTFPELNGAFTGTHLARLNDVLSNSTLYLGPSIFYVRQGKLVPVGVNIKVATNSNIECYLGIV